MPTISFTAPAVVFDFHSEDATEDDTPVMEDPNVLQTLDGIESDEVFSEFMSDGGDSTLADAGVTGGQLRFKYDSKSKRLYGFTQYSVPRKLTESEVALLKEYTIGQWSDGIGSNFFQERVGLGLAPQLFFMNDNEVLVEQRS